MEGDHRGGPTPWGGGARLAEGDVGDGPRPVEDANAALTSACEVGDAVHDVTAIGDFHDVGAEGVGAVPGDDDGGLGLVLGSGRPATWAPSGVVAVTAAVIVVATTRVVGRAGGVVVAVALDGTGARRVVGVGGRRLGMEVVELVVVGMEMEGWWERVTAMC